MRMLLLPGLLALLAVQDDAARRVQGLIEKVRSERIEDRNAAADELRKMGKDVIPLIEAAQKDADPEVALRLRSIVVSLSLPDAADTMKRIEQVFLAASTVRIEYHQESRTLEKEQELRQSSKGTLFFARGNKARLSVTPEKGSRILLVSDGTCIRGGDGKSPEPVEGLTGRLAKSVARAGISFYAPLSPWQTVNFTDEATPEPTLQPTDLRVEGGEEGAATLCFTLKTQGRHPGVKVRLSFDLKSFHPRRRTMTLVHPKGLITIVETYDDIQIDPELPEGTFKF